MIAKTLGGLSKPYYVRQLLFGLAIFAIFAAISLQSLRPTPVGTWVFMGLNVLLCP